MANYDPMQSVVGQAGLQLSGQGLAWEGKQKGLGRRAIQEYLDKQASETTEAGHEMSLWNLLATGLGAGATAFGGPLLGGLVAGGVSGLGGHLATKDLNKEGAPNVLYGVAEAEEAESYAHQAIDTLIGSVAPQALSTAITTPLNYMTLKNTSRGNGTELSGFTPAPTNFWEKFLQSRYNT